MRIDNKSAILLLIAVILTNFVTIHQALAETGKGEDVFRVILTIFGVDRSKGDMVAIVTVNNGEASRVKLLDAEAPYVISMANPNTPGAEGGLIEYVATFPNVTVNAGEEYKACVVTTKDLEPTCSIGNNSPASRPEFVDISLNATSEVDQAVQQEGNGEDGDDEENEG
ncbi:MAG TPA: hypothetical protein VFY68_17795 [Nitrososphaeraceae archaeon]|nr:hypothetical protein [Nitrososphaeraceae archaeon]